METPEISDVKAYPTCKICDGGILRPAKICRLSGPAVAIGYILLIPSIFGMACCAIVLFVVVIAATLGASQNDSGDLALVGGGGVMALLFVGCFVAGLLGWLLVMKKYVLQCDNCGAVVNASATTNRSTGRARKAALYFLVFMGLMALVAAIHFFVGDYRTWAKGGISEYDWTEFKHRWLPASTATITTAESAQPIPDNPAPAPAPSDTMHPFTSSDGRFNVLFPGSLQLSSKQVTVSDGETATVYMFGADADNGNVAYLLAYEDYPAAAAGTAGPQALLQRGEKSSVAGRTLVTDAVIDLDGVPGRSFTFANADGSSYSQHEFLAGLRFYQLIVFTRKGYTATQADQFMNSFRILDNPPQP